MAALVGRRIGLLFSCCAVAMAVSFTVDLTTQQAQSNYEATIVDSFGSSHAATTLRKTWRDHFAMTRQDIPFQRVRFHGVLDDDMSTYLNGKANGALVFDTFDFLVSQDIRPTVELGFMPEELASNASQTVFHYKGGSSPYRNASLFASFISGFVQLLIDRYSLETVRTWRFEVWNEPNCGFFFESNCCGPSCGNQTAYFELYETTARAVKAVDASLAVGGPATAQLAWIPEFLAFANASGAPVDFVSSHLYPTDPFIPATRDGFSEAVAAAAQQAATSAVPFYLTEFNAGLGTPNGVAVLDSAYAAGFLLHAHLLVQGSASRNVASMSYWTFTDFGFEEQGVDPMPWNPGNTKFGIMTMYGVPKPAYRALQLIAGSAASGQAAAIVTGGVNSRQYLNAGAAIVGATDGTVDVLVSVARSPSNETVTTLLSNFNISSGPPPAPQTVTMTYAARAGLCWPSTASLDLIDDAHVNPMAVWTSAGRPLYPSAAEIAAELATSQLAPQQVPLVAAGKDSVSATVSLAAPYAFARLTFVASLC